MGCDRKGAPESQVACRKIVWHVVFFNRCDDGRATNQRIDPCYLDAGSFTICRKQDAGAEALNVDGFLRREFLQLDFQRISQNLVWISMVMGSRLPPILENLDCFEGIVQGWSYHRVRFEKDID